MHINGCLLLIELLQAARGGPRRGICKKKISYIDSEKFYEIKRLGPIFLAWNMKLVKNKKGKLMQKKYKIKEEKVCIQLISSNTYTV